MPASIFAAIMASRMYPSMNASPAVEAPASSAAGRLYPSANPSPTTEAPQPAPSAPAPVKSRAASPLTSPSPQPKPQDAAQDVPPEPPPIEGVAAIYSAPMPSPQTVQELMRLPADPEAAGFATDDAARAERQEAASALHAAGLSRAEVGTAWDYAVRSAHSGYIAPDADATLAALRQEWGADYSAKLTAAQQFMRDIYARSPAIKAHVLNTGLANDLAFVRAVAAAATRRGAR